MSLPKDASNNFTKKKKYIHKRYDKKMFKINKLLFLRKLLYLRKIFTTRQACLTNQWIGKV